MIAAPVISKITNKIAPILGVAPINHNDPNIINSKFKFQKKYKNTLK